MNAACGHSYGEVGFGRALTLNSCARLHELIVLYSFGKSPVLTFLCHPLVVLYQASFGSEQRANLSNIYHVIAEYRLSDDIARNH